jgi:hypothetical protein
VENKVEDRVGNTMGNKVVDTVGHKLGDKVQANKVSETRWETTRKT